MAKRNGSIMKSPTEAFPSSATSSSAKSSARPRSRAGRPAAAHGSDLRERLLDTAVTLFASHGVAETSLNRIAAQLEVTPAMVHYYFNNRASLLDAVVAERLQPVIAAVWEDLSDCDDAAILISRLHERFTDQAHAKPWLPSLWIGEIAHERGQLREIMLRHLPLQQLRHFSGVLTRAQKSGAVHPDLEPGLVFLALIGLTLLPLATRDFWRNLPGLDNVTPARLKRHTAAFLHHGIFSGARS